MVTKKAPKEDDQGKGSGKSRAASRKKSDGKGKTKNAGTRSTAASPPAKREASSPTTEKTSRKRDSADGGVVSTAQPRPKKAKTEKSPDIKGKTKKERSSAKSSSESTKVASAAQNKAKRKEASKPKTAPSVKMVKKEEEVGEERNDASGGSDDERAGNWWEGMDENSDMEAFMGRGTKKWTTLSHNGVLFPPPYEPHGIAILYEGKPLVLEPHEEELATMYASMLNTDYVKKEQFNANFWSEWQKRLGKHKIRKLSDCDFRPVYDHLQLQREKKRLMSKAEKEKIKQEKKELDQKYGFAMVDGRQERVGNYRIEPPGLFRGRGEHPLMGLLKPRISPEDVTVNCGESDPVPVPPEGHKWKSVIHDNTVTWLAYWNDGVTDRHKYVMLAADSSFKTRSDYEKYEKARRLKKIIDKIRSDYTKDLRNPSEEIRQRATAMYLIDRLALRVGNEKGEDEADTVGCCSLRIEHVALEDNDHVTFDFLGKDSIQYVNTVKVERQVWANIKAFCKGKEPAEDLFDQLNPSKLNDHLKAYMDGLSAKVFRTYNASFLLDKLLHEREVDSSLGVPEKLVLYNAANRDVAILCNHQRSLPKGHEKTMAKLDSKLAMDRLLLEQAEKTLGVWNRDNEAKAKKTWAEYERRRQPIWEAQNKEDLQELAQKMEDKRQRLRAVGIDPKTVEFEGCTESELKRHEKLEKAQFPERSFPASVDSLEKACTKLRETLAKRAADRRIKDDSKTVSLTTSKINYMDPRITVAWCKKHLVDVSKIFSSSLMKKFSWTQETPADFRW